MYDPTTNSRQGGYNLNSISESFSSCVDAMLGGAPPRLPPVTPDWAAVESIKDVIRVHKKYWKSLCCDGTISTLDIELPALDIELPALDIEFLPIALLSL